MSIFPVLCDHVALPSSQIKGPGSILKNVNSLNHNTISRQQQIQKLLKEFKDMITTEPEDGTLDTQGPRPRASSHIFPELTINDTLVACPQMKRLINHLRTKSSNDEVEFLVKKAIQILGLYKVELVVEVNEKYHDELYNILSYLIPEICLFPEGFIKKLDLQYLIICDKKNLSYLEKKYIESNTGYFVINEKTNEAQVYKELYKIIFHHMVKINTKITEEWGNSVSLETESSTLSTQADLETAYMYLMQNTNHVLFKDKTMKLAKILAKHFPDELTEDWFKTHSKEKRKSCRVKIGPSITISFENN